MNCGRARGRTGSSTGSTPSRTGSRSPSKGTCPGRGRKGGRPALLNSQGEPVSDSFADLVQGHPIERLAPGNLAGTVPPSRRPAHAGHCETAPARGDREPARPSRRRPFAAGAGYQIRKPADQPDMRFSAGEHGWRPERDDTQDAPPRAPVQCSPRACSCEQKFGDHLASAVDAGLGEDRFEVVLHRVR